MSDLNEQAVAKYKFSSITELGQRRKQAFQRNLVQGYLPHMTTGARVLEVGPGRGEFAGECITAGYNYIGIEPSEVLCKQLISQGLNIIHAMVPPLGLEDETSDLVHSMDLIEHFDSYQMVLQFFEECSRVLAHGGYVSVIAPNFSLLGRLFYEYEYQHAYPTTEDRIVNLLQDAGFEVIKQSKFLFPWALKGRLYSILDRMLAHVMVPLGRSVILSSILQLFFGKKIVFRVHKNLYDHVVVLARKR